MKIRYFFPFLLILLSVSSVLNAQTFNGEWLCEYATYDNSANGTGYNVPGVAVINEDEFVAVVTRTSNNTCFFIGYTNADSAAGRLWFNGYGSAVAGVRQTWSSGFDVVEMTAAWDAEGTPDGYVYLANNDVDKNILVFKKTTDTLESTEYRMATGSVTGTQSLWGIDVDANGKVYVTSSATNENGKILVYEGFANDGNWAAGTPSTPLQTITVPDTGEIRGVTVNKEGTVIYATNYDLDVIYCYTGTPESGYTLNPAFSFTLTDMPIASTGVDTLNPGPWGIDFMFDKNLLFVNCANDFRTGVGYEYGRSYILNPNTGAMLDTIDMAMWNFINCDSSYQNRGDGDVPGNASSYTSPYYLGFDPAYNMYSVSHYGWTVDKWSFTGELPVIPLTIVSVEKQDNAIPTEFSLKQNYPNPFNPSTTIEFSIVEQAPVSLSVYTVTGELVTDIIKSANMDKGNYKVSFDASRLSSGNYIYKLTNGSHQLSKKMTVVK